jgi:hypothetical protein
MKQKQRLKRLERALGLDTHQVFVIIPDVLAKSNKTVVLNGETWMSEAELSQRDHTGSTIDPFGD